jgi:hypothetical protein
MAGTFKVNTTDHPTLKSFTTTDWQGNAVVIGTTAAPVADPRVQKALRTAPPLVQGKPLLTET